MDVWRELGVEDFGLIGVVVASDEDLADADGAAAVPQAVLHGLAWRATRSKSGDENTMTRPRPSQNHREIPIKSVDKLLYCLKFED